MWAAADEQKIPSREEMRRALEARHGADLQRRFSAASVAVCGLGGLGSNVAISLARAGVGRLHLMDFDRVDITNLHRQQYAVGQLGLYKTKAMKETLSAIAPYVEVTTDTVRMTEAHLELLRDDDIIVEAFDDPEAKAMLVNGVLERYPEKYMVAASGMAGMDSGNRIVTRRVTGRFYLCGDGESDVAAGRGLVAPRVMLCAAHEALTVLRILAGEYDA